ncbi:MULTISPECIES: class I adenylate-forming enzyme family protein [Actinomadura]|uniref:Class I adenylate-forming enzyme family protein n=1 Tax=Actinomadura yumaensis TaxID=111807 RepID=A0ABW2CMG2_9ACTN|nr:AMP-binding protein [Actinomadura sp. J1-007]MWK38725.1 AMP-binding protein [Actinomadura sp. J1-007]
MQSWVHVVEWRARGRRDQTAVRDDRGTALTYGELAVALERAAGGWAARGVGDGDVVAVVAKNSAAFLVQALGLMRAGAIPLFVNWRLSGRELAGLCDLAAPVAVVADPGFGGMVEESGHPFGTRVAIGRSAPEGWTPSAALDAPPPPRPAERLSSAGVFGLMHTSGTTGRPKLIPLVNGSLMRSLAGFAIEIGDQVAGSRHLQIMPLFHLAGFAQAMQCLLTAGTLIVHAGFEPKAVVDAFERDRVEFFTAGPSLIDMLVAEVRSRPERPDLGSLREIQYGSAPITPASLRAAIDTLGCRFRQIYGSTECLGFVSLLHPDDHRPDAPVLASAGQIVLGWEVRVAGPDGAEVPAGEPGELHVRGDGLFPGYWNDEAATAAAFDGDGWYRTGDIVRITADGYLHVLDRAKDMVISGGENVYPAEVEAVLAEHPAVAEVAVIGVPHPRWGEAVHAIVVPSRTAKAVGAGAEAGAGGEEGPPPPPEALIAWTRDRLAHFKCPKSLEYADALPRNSTGKILKRELRASRSGAA